MDRSNVRRRQRRCGFPPRLMLLVGVVLGLVMSLLVGPAHSPAPSTSGTASPAVSAPGIASAPASAKAQQAPLDRGSANVRHAPSGQPLAETARAFGSSTLAADATGDSDRPPFLTRAWTARSSDAVRRVLDTVAPRLGRAPPPYRVS